MRTQGQLRTIAAADIDLGLWIETVRTVEIDGGVVDRLAAKEVQLRVATFAQVDGPAPVPSAPTAVRPFSTINLPPLVAMLIGP